jgi:hypothetical protein
MTRGDASVGPGSYSPPARHLEQQFAGVCPPLTSWLTVIPRRRISPRTNRPGPRPSMVKVASVAFMLS